MLKLLIFGHWPRRIIALFDRSTLNVQKIGLFVNCMSAKPVQTHFLVQSRFLLQLLLVGGLSGGRLVWTCLGAMQRGIVATSDGHASWTRMAWSEATTDNMLVPAPGQILGHGNPGAAGQNPAGARGASRDGGEGGTPAVPGGTGPEGMGSVGECVVLETTNCLPEADSRSERS